MCVYLYVIMKTMCPPGYHHNGFVATHALGHVYIYIYIYIYIYMVFTTEGFFEVAIES